MEPLEPPLDPPLIKHCKIYSICTNCSIKEDQSDFRPIMQALYWHNMPAFYALNYADIFGGGLFCLNIKLYTFCIIIVL